MAKKPQNEKVKPLPTKDEVDAEQAAPVPAKGQQPIKGEGFEHKDIPKLTAAAEKLRATRDTRSELQRKEKVAKAERDFMLNQLIEDGELTIPPPEACDDPEERVVYSYLGADGHWHDVVWCAAKFKDKRRDDGSGGGDDE